LTILVIDQLQRTNQDKSNYGEILGLGIGVCQSLCDERSTLNQTKRLMVKLLENIQDELFYELEHQYSADDSEKDENMDSRCKQVAARFNEAA
jgi:hypothetical protein